MLQVSAGGIRVSKDLIGSRGNRVLLHQVLGKCLGSLDDRRVFSGPEDADSRLFKGIYDSGAERIILRADRQIDCLFPGESDQLIEFHHADIDQFRHIAHPGIAGRDIDLVHPGAFVDCVEYGVLSSAGADQ